MAQWAKPPPAWMARSPLCPNMPGDDWTVCSYIYINDGIVNRVTGEKPLVGRLYLAQSPSRAPLPRHTLVQYVSPFTGSCGWHGAWTAGAGSPQPTLDIAFGYRGRSHWTSKHVTLLWQARGPLITGMHRYHGHDHRWRIVRLQPEAPARAWGELRLQPEPEPITAWTRPGVVVPALPPEPSRSRSPHRSSAMEIEAKPVERPPCHECPQACVDAV